MNSEKIIFEGREHTLLAKDIYSEVAESPIYDAERDELFFVDILGKCYYRIELRSGKLLRYNVPEKIGCLALCEDGTVLVALENGIYHHKRNGELELAHQKIKINGERFNDGRVGPDGAFYVGCADADGNGSFYRLRRGELTELFSGCRCSNGIDFTSDGKSAIYCDTPLARLEKFDFDGVTGELTNRRTICEIPKELGLPDGLVLDADDGIWLGLWNGGGVLHLSADGALLEKIPYPARKVSSCTFVRNSLFVTTARKEDAEDYPLSGGVFLTRVDACGKSGFKYEF